MQKRNILVFAIVFISLVAISAASATEIETTDSLGEIPADAVDDLAVNEDIQAIEQSNYEETVSAADNGSFTALQEKINNAKSGSTINLENNYTYDDGFNQDGIEVNKKLTINGNGFTIDGKCSSRLFVVKASNVVFNNINFVNGYADFGLDSYDGGAIFCYEDYDACTVKNCVFTNNRGYTGGAASNIHAVNCNFTYNEAVNTGGAIYNSSTVNCNFINNRASYGSAGAFYVGSAVNCNFSNNYGYMGGAASEIDAVNCVFTDNYASNYGGGAISYGSAKDCIFINNIATGIFGGGAIYSGIAENCVFINNSATEKGGAALNSKLINCNFSNNYAENGGAMYNGWYYNCIFETSSDTCNESALLIATKITASSSFSTFYKDGINVVATFKDEFNNNLANTEVTFTFNGVTYKRTTDENGQAIFAIPKSSVPNTYDVKISFEDNDYIYLDSSKTVKVTVKKSTPKFVAKAKKFKRAVKIKKYAVVLKDHKNRNINNMKVYLKVKGKTYTAKTNSKGKAIFKISKLKKVGNYKAKLTYKGNANYNKITKTVKIVVKK